MTDCMMHVCTSRGAGRMCMTRRSSSGRFSPTLLPCAHPRADIAVFYLCTRAWPWVHHLQEQERNLLSCPTVRNLVFTWWWKHRHANKPKLDFVVVGVSSREQDLCSEPCAVSAMGCHSFGDHMPYPLVGAECAKVPSVSLATYELALCYKISHCAFCFVLFLSA